MWWAPGKWLNFVQREAGGIRIIGGWVIFYLNQHQQTDFHHVHPISTNAMYLRCFDCSYNITSVYFSISCHILMVFQHPCAPDVPLSNVRFAVVLRLDHLRGGTGWRATATSGHVQAAGPDPLVIVIYSDLNQILISDVAQMLISCLSDADEMKCWSMVIVMLNVD